MKTMKKIVCALMTLVLLLSSVPTVFADEADTKTIDQDAACSLTIWKFDYTNAKKDGVWDEDAFPSTGWQESYVENALVNTNRKGDTDGQNGNALGNGQTSKGYAIAGVEFTYLKAADIVTFENQGTTQVLYGFHKTDAADLLKAIGLENGANRCTEADSLDADRYFYTADTLNKALAQSLEANSTTVKNALETFMKNFIHNIIHPTTRRTSNRLPMPENVRKGFRRYSCAVLTGAMILGLTMPAYAANDPLTVVNNLSTFIFGLIRAVGLILLGWGIVQVGLSLQSHDPSQRSNGFLTLAGGIVITFAKEILDLIIA